jgi:hypothetical protein
MMTGWAQAQTALQVDIFPDAVRPSAGWRIVGATAWNNSGDIVTSVTSASSQFVEFKPVTGWISPDPGNSAANPLEVLMVLGQTNIPPAASCTYTLIPQTSIQVFVEPTTAALAGCQWQLQGEGPVFHNSGDILDNMTSGPATIHFQGAAGWIAPGDMSVTLVGGIANTFFGTFTPVPVFTGVMVTINPPEAALAGAQWQFSNATTTTQFLDSGAAVFGLTSGTGTVTFSNIAGWVTPGPQNVSIVTGQTAVTSGTYVQIPSTTGLQVWIEPNAPGGAVAAGAQWRRQGTVPYLNNGAVEVGLTSGPAVVQFKPVSGFITPNDLDVTILTDQITSVTGTYTALPPATALQVFIQPTPTSATLAGAQWRLVTPTTTTLFLDSGATVAGLTSGPATVIFSPVAGWVTPTTQTVAILTNQTVVTTGTYTLVPPVVTALQVFIAPAVAANAGAQWRRVGTTTFFSSGFIETGLTAGPAVVEFNSIIGWVSPANQNVTLLTGQTVVTTGTYAAAGSLQITIEPASAVAAGAQWRPVGTTPYFNSGDTEPLAPGTYDVEFKALAGFTSPVNLTGLVVVAGATTTGTGTYTVAVGAPGNYKISYKGCTVALDTATPGAATGLIVTGANAGTIKIQKLTKLPAKHADVAGKTLYMLNSPGLSFLTAATGTIKSLSGTGAFIPTITANVTGSIKMGVTAALPAIQKPATTILLPGAIPGAPRSASPTLAVSLTGVSLNYFVMTNEAASIKISAKKVKGATIPADVAAGSKIRVGEGLSLAVTGGNIYADLIESQGGIKSLSVKGSKTFSGGNIGPDPAATTTATLATLADTLTSPTLAVLQHPSTPVVVAMTSDIGKIGGANVDGVFVAGANLVNGLIHPTCSQLVAGWKVTNASGDAFISAPAKSQPAGIAAHTTAP